MFFTPIKFSNIAIPPTAPLKHVRASQHALQRNSHDSHSCAYCSHLARQDDSLTLFNHKFGETKPTLISQEISQEHQKKKY
jgi:hypothetical protein